MVMRARKRNTMVFRPGEPEKYEHAQDTRFQTTVDSMIADPAGRGPTPATSPLGMRPSATAEQLAETTDAALADYRQARTGDPNDPEAGDTMARPPRPEVAPMAMSPLARTPQAGYPNDPEQGDTQPIPGLEFPGETPRAPVQETPASFSNGQAPAPIDAAANAPQKPDYGRVKAEQIAPQSAGTAPPGGDKWLAAMRGVGSVLQSAGGKANQGMQSGLDAYGDFQDQERELRDFQGKQAALDADTEREQRGENRYAEGQNYGRARDEDATHRQNTNDRFNQDNAQKEMGFMERREARDVAGTEYERGQGRQDALSDYEKKLQLNAKYAPKKGGGGGARRNNVAQFDAARQRLAAIRGGEGNLTEEDKAAIAYSANDLKDPGGTLNKYADKMGGFVRQDQAASAKADVKSKEAAEGIEAADAGLANLEAALTRKLERNEQTLPNTTPGASFARGAAGVLKQVMPGQSFAAPQREQGESDQEWARREGDFKSGDIGPQGYSQDDSTINSFGALYARGLYYDTTQNSANLKSEADVADATVRSNGTVQGMLEQVKAMRNRLGTRKQSGQLILRDEQGNVIDANAPPQGQVFTNPEDM